MEYQELPNAKIEDADIVILPFAYEDTVSSRGGTKDAPRGILEITEQIEYYEEDLEWSPMKYMSVCVAPTDYKIQRSCLSHSCTQSNT